MEHTRESICALLNRNLEAVERAMVVLLDRQTEDEKDNEQTKHLNGVGFSSCNARLGTYYGNWVKQGKHLSGVHVDKARRIAIKHVRQLVEVANAKTQSAEQQPTA